MAETPIIAHAPRARDARGRFVAQPGATRRAPATRVAAARPEPSAHAAPRGACPLRARSPHVPRARTLPTRDSRGRFVAFPTTEAPAWYVLCVGACRIASAAIPEHLSACGPSPDSRPLPRATVPQSRRPWLTLPGIHSALLVLLVLFVSAWYGLHLATPAR